MNDADIIREALHKRYLQPSEREDALAALDRLVNEREADVAYVKSQAVCVPEDNA